MGDRTSTGIMGLDEMLRGGLPSGSTVLIQGAPGVGKTTFGLQFLYHGATKANEAGLLVTFEEFPESIYRDALNLGWDLRAAGGAEPVARPLYVARSIPGEPASADEPLERDDPRIERQAAGAR